MNVGQAWAERLESDWIYADSIARSVGISLVDGEPSDRSLWVVFRCEDGAVRDRHVAIVSHRAFSGDLGPRVLVGAQAVALRAGPRVETSIEKPLQPILKAVSYTGELCLLGLGPERWVRLLSRPLPIVRMAIEAAAPIGGALLVMDGENTTVVRASAPDLRTLHHAAMREARAIESTEKHFRVDFPRAEEHMIRDLTKHRWIARVTWTDATVGESKYTDGGKEHVDPSEAHQ